MTVRALHSVIGLGANLGQPLETFSKALDLLGSLGQVLECSCVYRSEAHGPPQPDYHNAAVKICFTLEPAEVLRGLMRIEQQCGRIRRERWGSRLLDLDWLWLEGQELHLEGLQVPHPRLTQRAFALFPLLDVVPEALEPRSGRPYTAWLPKVADQRIERLAAPGSPWCDAADCRR